VLHAVTSAEGAQPDRIIRSVTEDGQMPNVQKERDPVYSAASAVVAMWLCVCWEMSPAVFREKYCDSTNKFFLIITRYFHFAHSLLPPPTTSPSP